MRKSSICGSKASANNSETSSRHLIEVLNMAFDDIMKKISARARRSEVGDWKHTDECRRGGLLGRLMMATEKQLVNLIKDTQGTAGIGSLDVENRDDFYALLESMVYEHDACGGCRHFDRIDGTCKNLSNGRRTCVNRLFAVLSRKTREKSSENAKEECT